MNYLLALIPPVAWGMIGIIAKKSKGSVKQQTEGCLLGFALTSFFLFLIDHSLDFSVPLLLIGLVNGALIGVTTVGQFTAMREINVSRVVPLIASGQLVLNTLAGGIFFGEWQQPLDWFGGLLAMILIITGAELTSVHEHQGNTHSPYTRKGLLGVLAAIIGGGLYTILPNAYENLYHFTDHTLLVQTLMLPQGIGGLLFVYFFFRWRDHCDPLPDFLAIPVWKSMLAGFSWAVGNYFLLKASMSSLGLDMAYNFSQLNILVGGLGGIFLLHEKKTPKEMRLFLLGVAVIIFASALSTWL
ncbi:MAG: GRP family sugar transporter [Enterococcaceae bacterium]|nr:GRP family sugar transporter [Enterococcaceae bacterium]MCI1919344.1 GRP family sugar transporter [Enterococcaceae bacterium]